MYAIVVFVALALSLGVARRVLTEVAGTRLPVIAGFLASLAVAVGIAWALDYSVFAAFNQSLRASWMHPVATGFALVAASELLARILDALPQRSVREASSEVTPTI